MSLSVDGFWKVGFWTQTFWADGFWFEGSPRAASTTDRLNLKRGGGHWKKEKDEWYRRMAQDLLARYRALEERTLPPPETPVEQPVVVAEVLKPFTSEIGILRGRLEAKPPVDQRKVLRGQIKSLEADSLKVKKEIQRLIDIRKMDEEVALIAAMLDD
jgi:hypothetical protein